MDKRNIIVNMDSKNKKNPLRVKAFCPETGGMDVLIGEFDFKHMPYLWGALQEYADGENLDLNDLDITTYDINLQLTNDWLSKILVTWTPDGKKWMNVPGRFKYAK
jgi:hypothetical protein